MMVCFASCFSNHHDCNMSYTLVFPLESASHLLRVSVNIYISVNLSFPSEGGIYEEVFPPSSS